MKLFDAHCHLIGDESVQIPTVVNGTGPDDWILIHEAPHAAIGLHPWKVKKAAANWQSLFLERLPLIQGVGEIGLDGLCDVEMNLQVEAFRWQLLEAAKNNFPVSIHCLKASEPLLHVLKEAGAPKRGFHLHAYAGSAEQVATFVELGAYFSFHAGQLKGNAKKAPQAIQAVPAERLLIETDAPDSLKDGASHEEYLRRGYELAAKLRSESLESFTVQVADNYNRYFLND